MTAITITVNMMSRVTPFDRMRCALSLSPLPRAMEARGAPPAPTNTLNALTRVMIGRHSPIPVRDAAPISGICPMYILSTMLYKRLMSCATNVGMPMESISLNIGAVPILSSEFEEIVLVFITTP